MKRVYLDYNATTPLAGHWIDDRAILELRDRLWRELTSRFGPSVTLNGHPERRLPNTLNIGFPGASRPRIHAFRAPVVTRRAIRRARCLPDARL
ncbi:MAG: hypothetical protein FJ297_15190 [Planctomycetes bacterium]|nr:hypothetical protein [Planctomycetota bacterium]